MFNILQAVDNNTNKLLIEVDLSQRGEKFKKSTQIANTDSYRGVRIPNTDFFMKVEVWVMNEKVSSTQGLTNTEFQEKLKEAKKAITAFTTKANDITSKAAMAKAHDAMADTG